ncbi:MAG: tetratricopeptide repeat protein [Spirochaetaceae bacterium]|jgi:tetratricopeptide (TPR) repeat protein|nr:tetratricopeptide repeat protein [Spirochaetaceae bacterium]
MTVPQSLARELESHPEKKGELGAIAVFKARNGDFDEAEEIFAALSAFDGEDRAVTLNRAIALDQKADSFRAAGRSGEADHTDTEALRYYRQAMDADPAFPDAFFNGGFFFLKKSDYGQAKDCFETFLALTVRQRQDEDAVSADEDENARYKIERATEILNTIETHNLDDGHFKKANELISAGHEERGISEIRLFLEKNPTVWNAWFMLGWGLRRLNRWGEAKEAFSLALQYGGDNADTCNESAICCMELGQFGEAEKLLYRALKIEKENTKIMNNLGFLALKQGKAGEALPWFLTVLEYNPGDALAQQMAEKLGV